MNAVRPPLVVLAFVFVTSCPKPDTGGEDTIAHVPELAKSVIGFKLYMGNTFGNPVIAQAGAKDASKLDAALVEARRLAVIALDR